LNKKGEKKGGKGEGGKGERGQKRRSKRWVKGEGESRVGRCCFQVLFLI